jgi:hypothetical protein
MDVGSSFLFFVYQGNSVVGKLYAEFVLSEADALVCSFPSKLLVIRFNLEKNTSIFKHPKKDSQRQRCGTS